MLFSELYGNYYNAVAEILSLAVKGELAESTLNKVVAERAFGESVLTIPSSLKSEKWQLLTEDYKTPIKLSPIMPLTTLQKRWLKALSLDYRIKLFDIHLEGLEDVEPLFTPDMLYYFDKYSDGDDFKDEGYITRFRIINQAIKDRQPLKLKCINKKGNVMVTRIMPEYLEYSEKDDKFRLITSGCRYGRIIKLPNVIFCKPCEFEELDLKVKAEREKASLTFTLVDERNTLERAMLHFAHFEKSVEKTGDNSYLVRMTYDKDDETEILIRILSFGQFVKVLEPQSFVNLIKERLIKQKNCGI